jgi:putative NADPH-quinone reductase
MLKNFAYQETKSGLKGMLTHIKKATVISTSQAPTWNLRWFMGNPVKSAFVKDTLNEIGTKNVKWFNNGNTTGGTEENRKRFLMKVQNYFGKNK